MNFQQFKDETPAETFVQKIARLSIEATGETAGAHNVKLLAIEVGGGLAARDRVCIYATKAFSILILPEEGFKVAIQTENQSRLTVDAKYLEELTIVTKLQQAVQAELDAVKEWI